MVLEQYSDETHLMWESNVQESKRCAEMQILFKV